MPPEPTTPVKRYLASPLSDIVRETIQNQVVSSRRYPLRDRIDDLFSDPFPEGFVETDLGDGIPTYYVVIRDLGKGPPHYRIVYRVDEERHTVTVMFVQVIRFTQ